jgi:hypothetical protein
MDIEALNAMGERAVAAAIEQLKRNGKFPPLFLVESPAGCDAVTGRSETEQGWSAARDDMAEKIRELVRTKNAYAVIGTTDSWITEPLKGGRRRSAILIRIETPIYERSILQFYYRNAEGAIILRERQQTDTLAKDFRPGVGRFMRFFSPVETKAAQ